MGRDNQMVGGFVYRNLGTLENCYAAVRISKRKAESAGFVYDNKGIISHCFTRSRTHRWQHERSEKKKQMDGFYSFNDKTISDCFFLSKSKNQLKKYRDRDLGVSKKQANSNLILYRFSWDFTVFEEKKAGKMDFLPKSWKYTLPEEKGKKEEDEIQYIDSKSELLDLIDKINRGDKKAASGWYELTDDLNFHGKEIPPIGCDEKTPFTGVFDGKGHIIRGFTLNGKDRGIVGLFGYLKGKVANLRADGIVKGKNCRMTSAFCAVNRGEIHCCEALFEIHAQYNVGMFVGENHGLIERCSVSGKSHGLFFFWLFPLLPVMTLLTVLALNPPVPPPDYEPVAEDRSIIPNLPDDKPFERSNENKASYEVPKILKVDARTLTATDNQYVIQNPDRGANYNFVAAIYMTDNYGEKVEVYQSGSIPVGYHISTLTLAPPDGITLAPGKYEAEIVFSFYQQDTGEKGMVDSTVPITIEIK